MIMVHLLATGRTHVAHVAGPSDWYDAIARRAGWETTLEDSGLEPGACLTGEWTPWHGYESMAALASRTLPETVFCANDLIALGVLAGLRERGIEVPGDVAVVGYDDIAGAEYFVPALSTVRQPLDELGNLCLTVLLRAIDGEPGAAYCTPSRRARECGRPPPPSAETGRHRVAPTESVGG